AGGDRHVATAAAAAPGAYRGRCLGAARHGAGRRRVALAPPACRFRGRGIGVRGRLRLLRVGARADESAVEPQGGGTLIRHAADLRATSMLTEGAPDKPQPPDKHKTNSDPHTHCRSAPPAANTYSAAIPA